ncbi:hypothetical protein [Candidatus Neptunichlamydia sp. REUL1]|uniref:hypothetical protein n=1 Tax=Candidatus Neptunichlamydia sp. REUL1 TaxID=3064277 RepID=UPI002931E882|nr:hypothetical protein [Candidatus Neptunochlamydia sp. REUL1]
MRCDISLVQKNKLWIIKALDRASRKTVAWVLGRRSTATLRKIYSKVCHLDDWPAGSVAKNIHSNGDIIRRKSFCYA